MGPPSCMWSVFARNVVMRPIPAVRIKGRNISTRPTYNFTSTSDPNTSEDNLLVTNSD